MSKAQILTCKQYCQLFLTKPKMTSYWAGQLRPGKNIRRLMIGNQGVCLENKWESRQCCRDTVHLLL